MKSAPVVGLLGAAGVAVLLTIGQVVSPGPSTDAALTNLFNQVAARPDAGAMWDWSQDVAPTNGVPSAEPIKADWDFARAQLAGIGARVAVWTFHGPDGPTWALVAEAQVGDSRSNTVRRYFFPGRAVTGLPTDWPAEGTRGQ